MTTTYLSNEEFVPMAPEGPGTVNIHHCKDGPGNDKLYITRKDDGTILAYCHHCGKRGSHRVLGTRTIQSGKETTSTARVGMAHESDSAASTSEDGGSSGDASNPDTGDGGHGPEEPERVFAPTGLALGNPAAWDHDVKKWWISAGLTYDTARAHGIAYFPDDYNRPLLLMNSLVTGEFKQTKPFKTGTPKYDNYGTCSGKFYTPTAFSTARMYVVEDVRSGLRIRQDCPASVVYVLCGTKLTDNHKRAILDRKTSLLVHIEKIIVWLDNDSLAVRKAAHDIARDLRLLLPGKSVEVETDTREPKHMTTTELRYKINGV